MPLSTALTERATDPPDSARAHWHGVRVGGGSDGAESADSPVYQHDPLADGAELSRCRDSETSRVKVSDTTVVTVEGAGCTATWDRGRGDGCRRPPASSLSPNSHPIPLSHARATALHSTRLRFSLLPLRPDDDVVDCGPPHAGTHRKRRSAPAGRKRGCGCFSTLLSV